MVDEVAAIVTFTRTLAIEAKRDGIRANVLTPSLIGNTEVYARVMSDPESLIRSAVFRAIGKLKQSMTRFSSAPPLQIRVGQIETTSDGWIQICLSVSRQSSSDEHPQELTGLKPTQFVIHDDSSLVSEYEVMFPSKAFAKLSPVFEGLLTSTAKLNVPWELASDVPFPVIR